MSQKIKIFTITLLATAITISSSEVMKNAEYAEKLSLIPTYQNYPLIYHLQPTNGPVVNSADTTALLYERVPEGYLNLNPYQYINQELMRDSVPMESEKTSQHEAASANSVSATTGENEKRFENDDQKSARNIPVPRNSMPTSNDNYLKSLLQNRGYQSSRAVSTRQQAALQPPFGPYATWTPYNPSNARKNLENPALTRDKREATFAESEEKKEEDAEIKSGDNEEIKKVHAARALTFPAFYSFDIPHISHPHPVFPTAMVVHGTHHVVSPHGPILPPPLKEAILQMTVQNPINAVAYNFL